MSIILQRLLANWSGIPAADGVMLGVNTASSTPWSGPGYLAGETPADPDDPDSPDGRTRIDGALASIRVQVQSRIGNVVVAQTRSAADGTWRVDSLNPDMEFVVLGLDDSGTVNAAIQDRIKPAAY